MDTINLPGKTAVHGSLYWAKRKKLIIFSSLLLFFAIQTAHAQCKFLVWSDEFNYSGIPDSTKWTYDIGDGCDIGKCGWGNQEAQWYTQKDTNNAIVKNGSLFIRARKEDMGSKHYTSARLKTDGLLNITYGQVVIRAKMPSGSGTWAALWMLGDESIYGGWPNCGEIDNLEYLGKTPDLIKGTAHNKSGAGSSGSTKEIIITGVENSFHDYTIEWTPEKIDWYVDDSLYHTYTNTHTNWQQWPYDKPFYLIMNLALGGALGGDINDSIFANQVAMEVDYVRIYQEPAFTAINGKSKIFENEANLVYSTLIPANKYTWEVPAGVNIKSGLGTDSLVVDWGCNTGDIKLTIETDCDTVTAVNPVSFKEMGIDGKTSVYQENSNLQYSIPEITNATYLWTIPDGVQIIGSNSNNSILTNWGCENGNISVHVAGECIDTVLTSKISIKAIDIVGAVSVQKNALKLIYSVDSIPNNTYNWIIPPDASFNTGATAHSIEINWGTTDGFVIVQVTNGCGTTNDSLHITVDQKLIVTNFDVIDPKFSGFMGSIFSKVENPYPMGSNTSNYVGLTHKEAGTVDWAGLYTDLGYNLDFSSGSSFTMDVWAPKIGIVKMKLEDLSSGVSPVEVDATIPSVNTWNELRFDFPLAKSSVYDRITLFFDFGKKTLDTFYFDNVILSTIETYIKRYGLNEAVNLYPNPASEILHFKFNSDLTEEFLSYNIINMEGRTVIRNSLKLSNKGIESINTSNLKPGIYLFQMVSSKNIIYKKFIIGR